MAKPKNYNSDKINPFDYIKSIQKSKKDLIRDSEDKKLAVNGYNAYLTNKALSYYVDSILYANEMNLYHELDKEMQYAYYLNIVRNMNRGFNWPKKDIDSKLEIIIQYFHVNRTRANEILELLDENQIKEIQKFIEALDNVKT